MGTTKTDTRDGPFTNPSRFLIAGAGLALVSVLWLVIFHRPAIPLVFVALLATGAAVVIRPASSRILGLAALTGVLCEAAMSSDSYSLRFLLTALTWTRQQPGPAAADWDSLRMLLLFFCMIAAAAALVMLLPPVGRRVAVSLVVIFHFVGIWTATMTVEPSPLIWRYLWAYVYRPYLESMYVNNAFHFYAPDPGPATLVWFYIKYDDGSAEWFKIPQRGDNPVSLEYQRRLSLSESVNALFPPLFPGMDRYEARFKAGQRDGIPLHPDEPNMGMQYRHPQPYTTVMLHAYAYHIAHSFPREPGRNVVSVKIYRVVHRLLQPLQLAKGEDPTAPWIYIPYYQGEYNPDGKLIDPEDPYLYWVIPIVRKPRAPSPDLASLMNPSRNDEGEVIDYVERHARMETSLPKSRFPTPVDEQPHIQPSAPATSQPASAKSAEGKP
jgi:hypothetical protein